MNSSTDNSSGTVSASIETPTTRLVKYVFFQIFQIPTLLCLIFIFYCVCRETNLRRLHNHAMVFILISCFLILACELPVTLSFLHRGSLEPQVDQVCLYWIFINYTLEAINTVMMAFASIERYILIFSEAFITGSKRRKLCFHYIPMVFCCVIVIIWYTVLIFGYPCTNTFDFTVFLCNSACYQSNVLIGTLDWVGSVLLPVFIVIVFNILLLVRAILQKRRLHLPVNWRRTRKMIIQLLAVVVIFLCTQVPLTIFAVIHLAFDPNFLNNILIIWYYFTPYLIFLLTPFAYALTTKEVSKHWISLKFCKPIRVAAFPLATVHQPRHGDTVQ